MGRQDTGRDLHPLVTNGRTAANGLTYRITDGDSILGLWISGNPMIVFFTTETL
jgi:hypothetical protein